MNEARVIGVQMDLRWEDPETNRNRALELMAQRKPEPGSLVVLPEMFTTGFTMNSDLAEVPGGPTECWLRNQAQTFGVWILGGVARRTADGGPGNEVLVFNPQGERVANYRKQRPFTPGGEREHYQAGSETVLFTWNQIRVAPFICYDLRFPELFRRAARQRPELYTVVVNWPDQRIAHWIKLLQARAIENQAYVLGVNRVGSDPTHMYPGRSLLVNPWGEIVAEAGEQEMVVEGTLDLASLNAYRTRLPFLDDLDPSHPVLDESLVAR